MAYFRCTTGGSGKGNTLVVTCADDLAGATITCTNGTKTYTKTCPSTAPYEVTFYGLEAGTWTISATVSGNTYTTTVVITDYEAELGGFSWRAWVDLSENYTSSDFTDLDELLDTELAVRELMTIHACVDYLAGIATESADVEKIIENDYCAKWINLSDYALDTLYANTIIKGYMDAADKYGYGEWVNNNGTWAPKGNVPIMTANNAPYGEAFGTTASSANPLWKVFDGNDSTYMDTSVSGGNAGGLVGYKFTNPVSVKKFYFYAYFDGTTMTITVKAQYSDDNSTWRDAGTDQNYTVGSKSYFDVPDVGYHLYWRLNITKSVKTMRLCNSIQFYGRELKVSVPTMTGNTTPYGEASVNPATSTYPAWKAFDGDDTSFAVAETSQSAHPSSIGYNFQKSTVVKFVMLYPRYQNASLFPKNYKIQGSNDGFVSDINTLYEGSTDNANKKYFVAINNAIAYKQYRVYDETSATYSGFTMQLFALQFYGLDYSEKEFEEGTSKKWLYDHGLELETVQEYLGGGTITKNSDQIEIVGATSGGNATGAFCNVDFTQYTHAFARSGDIYLNNAYELFSIGSTINGAQQAMARPIPLPLAHLDVSSINATYNLYYSTANYGKCSLKELWLE